jgi:hypothetical protein
VNESVHDGRTKRGMTIGVISMAAGVANLIFRPYAFYIAPHQWTVQVGLALLVLFSLLFIAGGALAFARGAPRAYLLIGGGCLSATFQFISPEFAYSFMGPLFFKVGSSVMSPQPWVNLNLLPLLFGAFVSSAFTRARAAHRDART